MRLNIFARLLLAVGAQQVAQLEQPTFPAATVKGWH